MYYCDPTTQTIQQKGISKTATIAISGDNSYKAWIVHDSYSFTQVSTGNDWMNPVPFSTSVKAGDLLVVEVKNTGTASPTNPGGLLLQLKVGAKIVSDASWRCIVGQVTLPITKCVINTWPAAVELGTYQQAGLIWTTVHPAPLTGFDLTPPVAKWIWTAAINNQNAVDEVITCAKILPPL